MYLRNGQVCVVDLGAGEVSTTELSEELAGERSAIARSARLHEAHPDSLVLGTGLLTGSLVPAACAGIASRISSGRMVTMPIMGAAGIELKLSGFDFIVVRGAAESLCYLWVRDGLAEVVPAEGLADLDSWQRTEKIRTEQGDRKIQVLSSGPWGDASLKSSSIAVSHWLGEDEQGLALVFGGKRLAAIAFRGMGELELSDPDGHLEACLSLRREHSERLGRSEGLESFTEAVTRDDFRSLVHRVVGCYGCPYPCRSFLKIEEDSKSMALAHKEPGYLHFDIPFINEALSMGMTARDATAAMMECARHGADALSVLRECGADLGGIKSMLSSHADIPRAERASLAGSFSACSVYERALALGLCPRYWEKAGMDAESISKCAEPALGGPID